MKLVLTCEHATNNVPREFSSLFAKAGEVLESHRGYDLGSLDLFTSLSPLSDAHFKCEISRLVVEVNRSVGHSSLFSEFTQQLSQEEKNKILQEYYFSYRNAVEKIIAEKIERGEKVLHFSVHTFTPVLNGVIRKADVGLLYDPERKEEKEFCHNFKNHLKWFDRDLKFRFNYPYLGKADGFTTLLRKKFPEDYLGIEIEVNQKFVFKNAMSPKLKSAVFSALKHCLEN